jgi:hypothetical protein
MTKAQDKAIKWLRESALYHETLGGLRESEVKRFDVVDLGIGGLVMVHLSVGKVGDEGTYGELFGRLEMSVIVGPKGAMKRYRKGSNGTVSHKHRDFWFPTLDGKRRKSA